MSERIEERHTVGQNDWAQYEDVTWQEEMRRRLSWSKGVLADALGSKVHRRDVQDALSQVEKAVEVLEKKDTDAGR